MNSHPLPSFFPRQLHLCHIFHTHANDTNHLLSLDEMLRLWKGVADSGLIGEVLSSLQTEILATLKGVEVRSENASLQEPGEWDVCKHWMV